MLDREMTMTLVNRRLALSGLFSAVALIAHTTLPRGTAAERVAWPSVEDIQQSLRFVPDRMAHYHVPGLSLACIHNGTVEWTQAFGVARVGGEPVTPEAGATVHGFEGYAAGKQVPTLVQALNGESPANSAPVTIDFVPGTKFRYAGGNYTIIQQILIEVTGEPFPELMQELVLRPLHMVHSTFQQPIPEQLRSLVAMPYDKNGHAIVGTGLKEQQFCRFSEQRPIGGDAVKTL